MWLKWRDEIYAVSDNWPYEISADGYEGFLKFCFLLLVCRIAGNW